MYILKFAQRARMDLNKKIGSQAKDYHSIKGDLLRVQNCGLPAITTVSLTKTKQKPNSRSQCWGGKIQICCIVM